MPDFPKGKRAVVFVDGNPMPYDGIIKLYTDSLTGNWVVDTNMPPEEILALLDDARDHFSGYLEDDGIPDELSVVLMPSVPGLN